jgi:two-component system, chemotaxis family, sensor kinase CheA
VGTERFIIPALAIVRSQRIEPDAVTGLLGRSEMLSTPQGLVPLIRLRELFGRGDGAEPDGKGAELDGDGAEPDGDGPEDDICTIVCAADGSAFAGLVVSELLGQHQIVMKSLGAGLGDVSGVSGAAILADGTVGLVIDVQQTVRLAHGGKG